MLKSILKRNKKEITIDPTNIPEHVAIIMDGNGRWAKSYGLPRSVGHRKGAEVLRSIVISANDLGIKALTVYGFSTENWKRPQEEVSLLMCLIEEYLTSNVVAMHDNNVRVRFIGDISALSENLQYIIREAESLTAKNTGLTLQLAINYGGRNEITRAVQHLAKAVENKVISVDEISEDLISEALDTKEFPNVDLLIRPSGDSRISNFLLWQLAYAEFWFTPKNWPEFDEDTLKEAILAFQSRERRFGGLKEDK